MWENLPLDVAEVGGLANVTSSIVSDGHDGNSQVDPEFVDEMGGNFRLTADSTAAIDMGDDTKVPAGITLDLDKNPRFVSTVDMGAYELQNAPPMAEIVCMQLTNIGAQALVKLDGSGSSDPDEDELEYAWFVDGDPIACPGLPTECAVIEVFLDYGSHDVMLVVTDTSGVTDDAMKVITLDPAQLTVFDVDKKKGKVKFNSGKVELKGEIGLPLGVDFSELDPLVLVSIEVADVEVLPAPLTPIVFDATGSDGKKWKYKDDDVFSVTKFDIDWKGTRFKHKTSEVELKSDIITSSETVLELKYKQSKIDGAFSLLIDGREIAIDADGNASTSAPGVVIDEQKVGKEVTFTLDFAMTETSVVEFTGGYVELVDVPSAYDASIGRYNMKAEFDPDLFPDGAETTPRTLDVLLLVGTVGYSGTLELGPDDLEQKSHEWKAR